MLVLVLVLGLALVGALGCWSANRWERADDFVAQLRCGMDREQIDALVRSYPRLELHMPDSNLAEWNLLAERGGTTIWMKLEEDALRRYQVSWIDTIKHRSSLPRVELCVEVSEIEEAGARSL